MNSIAPHITEITLLHGGRLFVAPTGVRNIVSLEGSVLGGSHMLPRSLEQAAVLAIELLDAGTAQKNKSVIRGTLASQGATLSFGAGGDRTYFSGSCLPEDMPVLLQIAAECLGAAHFPALEIASAQKRAASDFEEEKTDTRAQAGGALSRLLYDPSHVDYSKTTAKRAAEMAKVTRTELVQFRSLLGQGGLVLVLAGDVDAVSAQRAVARSFGKLGAGTLEKPQKKANTKKPETTEQFITIPDKANIDFFLGAAVPLTYTDDRYVAFATLMSMLGGRGITSGHLMRTIRERDGYTYGIRANAAGFADGTDGAFQVWATFSPATYAKAVAATKREIGIFFKTGITADTLKNKQTEMVGSYLVGMSTSRGLARVLHQLAVEGRPLTYIDEYPRLIQALTVSDLQQVASLIPLTKFSTAAAGTPVA